MIRLNSARNASVRRLVAVSWALLLLALLMSVTPSFAQQVSATLFGTITDPAGAVIPDATVTATNPANGRTTTTTTQGDGSYVIPSLEPADYTITVQKTGFDKF